MLSVIILTNNRISKLEACLSRLEPQLASEDEIILVDTGSTDETRQRFAHLAKHSKDPLFSIASKLRLVLFDGTLGSWAEARNLGVSKARGSLIAFLDDDCFPEVDWVSRGKAALLEWEGGADVVGGITKPYIELGETIERSTSMDGSELRGIREFPDWWSPEMGWLTGLSIPGHLSSDAGRIHYPCTANLWARAALCREEPFQEIGGELNVDAKRLYAMGREDAEWWRRLRLKGYRTRFDSKLIVAHAFDPSRLNKSYLKQRAVNDGRAWAVREGHPSLLPFLAYQWQHQFGLMLSACFQQEGVRRPHWFEHSFMRCKISASIATLAQRHYPKKLDPRGWAATWFLRGMLAYAKSRLVDKLRAIRGRLRAQKPLQGQAIHPKKMALIALGFLGDGVVLQSGLRGFLTAYPDAELFLLVPESMRSILDFPELTLNARGQQRIHIASPPEHLGASSWTMTVWMQEWLDAAEPDVIVAPYLHPPLGIAMMRLRRPPRPIITWDWDCGLPFAFEKQMYGMTLVHKRPDLHESINLCELFRAAGFACEPAPAILRPSTEALSQVEKQLTNFHGEFLFLNPAAREPNKEWTADAWLWLIEKILLDTPYQIILNSPKDHISPELDANYPRLNATGRLIRLESISIEVLFAWIAQSRAVITVETGIQHFAHALNIPSLTLYGPTDERRWSDLFKRSIHKTLRACARDLTASELSGLPKNYQVSMISSESVFKQLLELLKETAQ